MEYKHLMYCPWTGLGLYDGFRGNRWLKNRIKIFKQFVIPNLLAQSNQNFTLWCSWRREEMNNKIVRDFVEYMKTSGVKTIHTFTGVCFYDDKYPDEIARERLIDALHGAAGPLLDETGGAKYVLMTIQPSDDLYHVKAIDVLQNQFDKRPEIQAIGFAKGYICNYQTKELKEYNPKTNPPFYTIKFKRDDFVDALKHVQYTGMKHEVGKYKVATPLPSHEYVGDCLRYLQLNVRGFLVGTHLDNISTGFDNPFAGEKVGQEVLEDFGIDNVGKLKVAFSIRKKLFNCLSYKVKRKFRYLAGEKQWIGKPIVNALYNFLRG